MVLLEVLISILLFAFGVLGLVGMQTVATQNSANAQDRATASMLANDMVSQMWIKKSSTVSSVAIAADIVAWQLKVQKSGLPNVTGDVADVAGLATVTVTWRAPSKLSTDGANRYETSVFVQ